MLRPIRRSRSAPLAAFGFLVLLGLAPWPGCGRDERPNVLLVSIDTLRPDRLSAYGHFRRTPAVDALADRGVRFANAFSPSPWTLPAHAAMLSGQYPGSIGDDPNSFDLYRETRLLSSYLGDEGYATGAITDGLYVGRAFGLAEQFDHFSESIESSNVAQARAWLAQQGDEPFFLFFHTYVVHAPYLDCRYAIDLRPGRLGSIYEGATLGPVHESICCEEIDVTQDEQRFVRALYDGGVAAADEVVGRLWAILGRLDLRHDTLVIVTSDHGEEFWEHTGRGAYHGHTLYDELLRVPLVWVDPASPDRGRVVRQPVSLVDIVPTVLARVGITPADPLDGESLAPLIEDGDWEVDRVIFAEGSLNGPERKSVRAGGDKLIVTPRPTVQGGDGKLHPVPVLAPVELYGADDRAERHNVARSRPDRVRELMEALQPRIARMPEDRRTRSLEGLDAETREALRALGYAQ
jgi:arylsulfatase A-like enzyme